MRSNRSYRRSLHAHVVYVYCGLLSCGKQSKTVQNLELEFSDCKPLTLSIIKQSTSIRGDVRRAGSFGQPAGIIPKVGWSGHPTFREHHGADKTVPPARPMGVVRQDQVVFGTDLLSFRRPWGSREAIHDAKWSIAVGIQPQGTTTATLHL
ncbi:hypothetical protein F4780DRAFT_739364 [Xylariomycetidae sp. FL0641]|nr:hypothetical protein F4780DRAFT_739364 [Xylariomycetidae sp. FL0641]